MSPGQVKVKNGFLTLRLHSGHTSYPIGFKPSAFHKVMDTYNLHISDFWYLWPEARSISWPHHYKSTGKNSNRSYWMIVSQNHLNPSQSRLFLGYSWCSKRKMLLGSPGPPWPIHALRANLEFGLTESKLISFDPSWWEKHNGAKIIVLSWLENKLFAKNYFA